jgi:hypothetical protein
MSQLWYVLLRYVNMSIFIGICAPSSSNITQNPNTFFFQIKNYVHPHGAEPDTSENSAQRQFSVDD